MRSTTLNTAEVAPMPTASVRMATTAKPGFLASMRRAKRKSCSNVSIKGRPRCSRYASFVCSTPPNSRRAACCASSGLMPRRMFSPARSCKCERSSASRFSSPCRLRKKPSRREPAMRKRLISRSFRTQQTRDNSGHALPAFRFGGELFPAGARQRVILRFAIVVRDAPLRGDPAALLQPQQRRIQRALIQLQQVLGNLLDALRDAVAVQRSQGIERLQNDQVQGSLENLASRRGHRAAPLDKQQEASRLPVERQQEACLL